ncbi:MAG: hypothetical protein Q6373_002130 [Candidatus Sigynarchaeota archaeon]
MKTIDIEDCKILQDPNHPLSDFSRLLGAKGIQPLNQKVKRRCSSPNFASIILKTDDNRRVFIDITCGENGNIFIDITPVWYSGTLEKVKDREKKKNVEYILKVLEIDPANGKTIVDEIKYETDHDTRDNNEKSISIKQE